LELELFSQTLIYVHAILGGIALLSGGVSLIAKKGRKVHKKSGKVFFYSMLLSAFTALIISALPNHESPFLFSIGLFSSYFILSGYRALRYKKEIPNLTLDKALSFSLLIVGISMILYPIIVKHKLSIVLTVFGVVGLTFGVLDLIQFRNHDKLKKNWLKTHLGKMVGGYIAATTAFAVVNGIFPGIYSWFIPGVIGGFYIYYWNRKIDKK